MYHVLLRSMHNLMLLGGIFYIYVWLSWYIVFLKSIVFVLIFFLDVLSIIKSRTLTFSIFNLLY